MRTYPQVPILIFASLSFLAACSSDPEPEPVVPPPPVEATNFMDAYTNALCDRASECFITAAYLKDSCKNNVRQLFGEDLQAAIAKGSIVYDADAAGACIAGLAAMDCLAVDPSDATLASCFKAMQGTIPQDKPCFGTFQCESGVCRSVVGDSCPAVCAPVAKLGEGCSLISAPDCDARKGLRCSGGTCVAPAAGGGACVDNYGCQSGLVCVANQCVPLRQTGYGCAQDSSCAQGNFCASGGDEGGVCEARLGVGAVCGHDAADTNAAFRRAQCQDGLVCLGGGLKADGTSVAGVCAKAVDEWEKCTIEPPDYQLFDTGCRSGLGCSAAGQCVKPPLTGEPCGIHFACQSDKDYCDGATLMCTNLRTNGQICSIDPECAGGRCGSMGTCVDLDTFCGP